MWRTLLFGKQEKGKKPLFVPGPKYETRLVQLLRSSPKFAAQSITRNKNNAEFLPVFIHPFLLDENCKVPFDDEVIKYYNSGLKLLLDFSTESLIFHEKDHLFSRRLNDLHRYLVDAGLDANRIYLLNANSAARSGYLSWCHEHRVSNPMQILEYDFYLYESTQAISSYYHKSGLFQELLNHFAEAKPRKYAFSCLNLKAKPHRWAMAVKLLSLVPQEALTFSFLEPMTGTNKLACDALLAEMDNAPALKQVADQLEKSLPVTVDYNNVGSLQNDIYKLPSAEGVWESLLLFNKGSRVLLDSYIDVVNETWFTDASCCFFSEKTLRPLVTLKPFILAGCPFSLKRLQDLGYKTFHPYINEDYDQISDPVERMRVLHRELERLAGLSMQQLHEMQQALKERLIHNYYHALTLPKVHAQLLPIFNKKAA